MSTTPVYGWQAQLGIDTANPVAQRFDFQSSSLGISETLIDTNGLRGTRSHGLERVRDGEYRVDGDLVLHPTSLELSHLLQWGLGGTPTGVGTVTYPLADAVPSRFVTVDKGVKVLTWSGCCVNRLSVRGSQGQPLEFGFNVAGLAETVANAGTFPALGLDTTTAPFVFYDCAISIAGVTYFAREFALTVDNALDLERFFNSQSRTALVAQDRHVSLDIALPAGDAWAVYGAGAGAGLSAGVAVTITATNGGAVLTFSLPAMVFPKNPVPVSRPEIMLLPHGSAFKSGSNLELTTSLAVGP